MAQRDEGMDKLEAFNASAAETRAALQRGAERAGDASDVLDDLGERIDHQMRGLGHTARELDARYGPLFEQSCGLAAAGALAPGGSSAAGWVMATVAVHSLRQDLIATADALELAYEEFPRQRAEAVRALDEAETAASAASGEFAGALRAFADDVEPRAEAVVERITALRQLLGHHFGER